MTQKPFELFIPQIIQDKLVPGGGMIQARRKLVIVEPRKTPGSPFSAAARFYAVVAHGEEEIGGHYHKDNKVEIMTCLQGVVVFHLHRASGCETVRLEAGESITIYAGTWHKLELSEDAILAVLTEHEFALGEACMTGFGTCSCGHISN